MRRLAAVAPFAVLVVLVVACGRGATSKRAPTPAWPPETWQLEYATSDRREGTYRLVIDSNGSLTTEDKRTGLTRQGRVDPQTVANVQVLMLAANLPAVKSDPGLPQPDSITWSLKVTSGNASYGGTFILSPLPDGMGALFNRLDGIYLANRP